MKSSPVAVRVASPAAVVASVPYLLGFHPTESLVVIALTARHVTLTTRVDLTGCDAEEIADAILPALARVDPDEAILVAFTNQDPHLGEQTVRSVAPLLADLGIRVVRQLLVTGSRWHRLDTTGGMGGATDGDLADSAADLLRAQFVAAGFAPGSSRRDLAARLEPGHEAKAVKALLDDALGHTNRADLLGRFAASWPHILGIGDSATDLTPSVVADAIAALTDRNLRDLVIAWLVPGTVNLESFPAAARDALPAPWLHSSSVTRADTARLLDRLLQLARLTPAEHAPEPLTVLAAYAWSIGDGATAQLALQRALDTDPRYRLAGLLAAIVRNGIRITD